MPDSPSEARLQEFERRWQHDRSPRVFLQFADELRRAGRTTRAIEILTEGLERHPDSVSGMVALGKTLLDADEPEHARTFLDRAIERDPSQYVANRLLVDCSLRLGDLAGARERLAICRLLNDRDPELEALAEEIEAAGADGRSEVRTAEPTGQPIFDLPDPARLPALELSRGAAATAQGPGPSRRTTPFGLLEDREVARSRILSHFRAEGIFAPASAAPVADAVAVPEVEAPEPGAAPLAEETTPTAPAVPLPTWTEAGAESGREVDDTPVTATPTEPPESAPVEPAEPMFSLQSIGAEVESEGEAPIGAGAGPAPGTPEDGLDELPEVEPRTAPSTADAAVAETATLGNLYLAQGHLDEAERAFRAALDRHSDDAVARRGLEEIERRRAVASVPTPQYAGGGPTQRKIAVLGAWMSRLRTERLARRTHVP